MRRTVVLMVMVLVAALGAAVYFLRIEAVRVTGVSTLQARTVIEASGLEPGDRILLERLTAAERRIERIPAVAEAIAERSLPSTVVIHVKERVPVARLEGARGFVVDGEGFVFEAGARDVRPVLYGWKGKPRVGARLDRTTRGALAAYEDFPERIKDWGRRLTVGDSFTVTLAGGTEVRFGSLRDLDAKARIAVEILKAEADKELAYVDVRSPTVPVSRPKEVPTPTPSASPGAAQPAPPAGPATPAPTPAPTPSP